VNVTAEVCSHHISLTEDAVEGYNTNAKMNPPLRTASDIEALQQGLADGTIDLLVTDHAPHHYDEKEREFADAPNGIVGLETALGVNCTYLLHRGVLSLSQMVDAMSCKPARVFHLPGGSLARGSVGDVSIFDPIGAGWSMPVVSSRKGRNTPYGGHELRGQARITLVGGRVVYRAPTDGAMSSLVAPVSDAELTESREGLAACCRRLHAHGLLAGSEGNCSERLRDGTLLVTASGSTRRRSDPSTS
jgi:dihydroorotase